MTTALLQKPVGSREGLIAPAAHANAEQLNPTERDKIAYWYAIGKGIREMARRLHRSPSSISDELKRNRVNGIYHSIHAHKAAVERKKNFRKKYLLQTRETLKAYVFEKLDLGWSPEQIAGRLKKEIKDDKRSKKDYINHESIYQYIYDPERKQLKLWEKLARSHMNTPALAWQTNSIGKGAPQSVHTS